MGKKPDDPEPTAQEEAAADISVEQWNEYANHWSKPVQRWSQNVAKDKSVEMAQATGMTNADIAQQAAGTEHTLGKSGMNPNSGRAMSGLGDMSTMDGTTSAGAAVGARQGVEDNRLAGLGQVAAIGMGQKATATQGIQDIAASSVEKSIANSMDKQQDKYTNASMIGGIAGGMAGAYANRDKTKAPKAPKTTTTRLPVRTISL